MKIPDSNEFFGDYSKRLPDMVTPLNAGPRPDSEPCLLSSYPFRMTMRPRHVDLDAGFHLSWRALAECHEESRTRFLVQTFGEDFLKGKRDFRMLPVRVTYDYLRPASYPEPLEAGWAWPTWETHPSRLPWPFFRQGSASVFPAPLPCMLRETAARLR